MNVNGYGRWAVFYDKLQEADYEEIGEYYHKLLVQNGAESGILLDLACGTGVLSRYFANLNYDVIGADISPEMLSVAAEKPHKNIQYLCQDMTGLDLFGTIDCCICVLDGLNHLPDTETLEKAFARVSMFMNKGGVFIFDVNTVKKHRESLSGNTFIFDFEDIYCVWQNSYFDENLGKIDMTLDIFARDENSESWSRTTEQLSERAYPLLEIEELLKNAGFGEIQIYDWLMDAEADEFSEKAVFTAIKL